MLIEAINENYTVLTINKNGKVWEVRVHIDPDETDGGIEVVIGRDDVYCTGTEFGWDEKHCNEPQEG
jgi:hypothetical protein